MEGFEKPSIILIRHEFFLGKGIRFAGFQNHQGFVNKD